MAIAIAYLFYFIAASASPLQRRWLATREDRIHDGQIHFASRVALIIAVLGLLLPFFSPFYLAGSTWYLIVLALICGTAGATYFISMYSSQRHVEAGVTTLVNNIYTPVTIILATLFLSERLDPIQIAGTALLLTGLVIVSKKHKVGKIKYDKYFMMMLLSGVALGVLLTAERALQKATGFTAGTLFSWWSQFIFLAIIVFITKSKSKYSKKDISITGGLRFLQALSWVVLIFVVGNLSLVSAVTTFKVVIIFIAAAIFLNEREDLPRKIVGSLVALAGLLLM